MLTLFGAMECPAVSSGLEHLRTFISGGFTSNFGVPQNCVIFCRKDRKAHAKILVVPCEVVDEQAERCRNACEISPWKSMVTAMVVKYGGKLAMQWEVAKQLWVDPYHAWFPISRLLNTTGMLGI